jgi:uncharacterized protein (DUF934 family)
MRCILRLHEVPAEAAAEIVLTIPLAALRADPERWRAHRGPLGVRLAPADAVEDLAGELPLLSLIEVEFPNAGEGRGYSQARLLRERLGFRGELRAVGDGVRQDRLFLIARCGFDAFELAPGEDAQAARRALARYDVAYQPGSSLLEMRRQRFHGGGSSSALR